MPYVFLLSHGQFTLSYLGYLLISPCSSTLTYTQSGPGAQPGLQASPWAWLHSSPGSSAWLPWLPHFPQRPQGMMAGTGSSINWDQKHLPGSHVPLQQGLPPPLQGTLAWRTHHKSLRGHIVIKRTLLTVPSKREVRPMASSSQLGS